MILHRSLLALVLFTALPSFAGSEDLPVIGMDSEGAPVEEVLPRALIRDRYREAVTTVHDSVLPALRTASGRNPWRLRTVAVGVGFGAELGLGPIIKVKASPRFRVVFSNSQDPILP